MKRVVLAFGTRPEAIKMAPVYRGLAARGDLEVRILLTGQHKEQLDEALSLFELPVDANLKVMSDRQRLPELAGRILPAAARELLRLAPDLVLVHGDTLTTFAVGWAAFLEGFPLAHVEAGLRSHRLREPFPEEANRRLVDLLADLLLAPTPGARKNLLAEGIPNERVVVTGQTGIDAIRYAAERAKPPPGLPQGPLVTITLHRRENWPKLPALAGALARLARTFPERTFIYPLHKNPLVREAVVPVLGDVPNFRLIEPLPYGPMAALLKRSELIVTDSGGLQEEGAALGVPVAVVRDVTERPEGVKAGALVLAGTDPERVWSTVARLLSNPDALAAMRRAKNPFGDGRAGERVAAAVAWFLGLCPRPADWIGP